MMTELKNITLIILIALIVLLGFDWYRLNNKVNKLEKELLISESTIEQYREANKVAMDKAESSVKIVEKEVVKIEKQYVPQIKYVKEYVKDESKSDCDNVRDLINSVVY